MIRAESRGHPKLWVPTWSTGWAWVRLPDRPYVLVVMSNYGGNGGAVIEAVSALDYDYFSRLSGVTGHGTRVPLDVKARVLGPG